MRKVLTVLSVLAIALAVGVGVGVDVGNAQAAKIKWRMTTHIPKTLSIWDHYIMNVVNRVTQLTDGEIEITPYEGGVIAPAFKAVDAVLDGTADAVNMPLIYLVNRDPANGIFGAVPGGMAAVAADPGIIDTEMLRVVFGDRAANHPTPKEWAKHAAERLLKLKATDNGIPISLQ